MVTVKKRNVEKVIKDSDLSKFLKNGYVRLDSTESKVGKPDKTEQKTLDEMKVPELKELAKSLGISGYSNLTQAELIKVIRDHDETGQQ